MLPGITAIVVSAGLIGLLRHCLDCLAHALAASGRAHRAVVVDNASELPYRQADLRTEGLQVELIRLDIPRGFGAANNAAVARYPGEDFLLVNNDVFVHPQAVGHMLTLLEATPRAGICGARLVFPDGTIQHRGVVFGKGQKGPYHLDRRRPGHLVARLDGEFQAVTGACMLIRGEAWQQLGGFDEDYPFGLEDIDFCLRARQQGWRVLCAAGVDSLHFESMTPGRVELDVPSRRLFMERWRDRTTIDG
ncbi:MAG: glycosyltransferase family 2 protein [Acidobacteriota bacterium]